MLNRPLDVEVVAHVTGSMNHCDHCQVFIDGVGVGEKIHREDLQSYPEDFIRDWQRVSDWVLDLAAAFPGQLVIRITDAQSVQGLWKSLTKGVRKYPTFIVGGQEKYHGWDHEQLSDLIRKHLEVARG
jgi:hypothetical protein